MRESQHTTVALMCALWAVLAVAGGGGWVDFADETAIRMPGGVWTADIEEKDYAWGDVDKDGDVDLVVVRKQPFTTTGRQPNVLFMNEGIAEGHAVDGVLMDRSDQYAAASNIAGDFGFFTQTNDRDVVLVDVNGDTWLDVVTSTTLSGLTAPKSIGHPRIYINQGLDAGGNWLGFVYDDVDRVPTMATEPRFCGVAAGDVDGDNDIDLFFADYDQGPYGRPIDLDNRLWINDGTGYFTDQSTTRMTATMRDSSFGTSVVIADMNGDGVNELINNTGLSLRRTGISYNDPANEGVFNLFSVPYTAAGYFVAAGDLNGDGHLDLAIADDGTDVYMLWTSNAPNGIANFTELEFPNSGGFGSNTVIADLDNDGNNDVLIADVDVDITGCGGHLLLYRNLGNTPNVTMSEEAMGIPVIMRSGTHDVAVFDIDGDCWLDLVIGRCNGTQVWINQAPGSACPVLCPTDINGDGTTNVLDLIDLLLCFGQPAIPGCVGEDINEDGNVNVLDLIDLLLAFGTACP